MIRKEVKNLVEKAIKNLYKKEVDIKLDRPTESIYGDYSTNIAIILNFCPDRCNVIIKNNIIVGIDGFY